MICEVCHKEFETNDKRRKHSCSPACALKYKYLSLSIYNIKYRDRKRNKSPADKEESHINVFKWT